MPDNLRHAQYRADGSQIDDPQKLTDDGGGGGGGAGTVTSVSITTANGVSGAVANATTTPAITLSLGAITPTSVTSVGAVSGTNLSGTNTGDQTLPTPGGIDTLVQYNNAGALGGMTGVTWVLGTSTYTFGGGVIVNFAGSTSGNVTLKAPAAAGAAVVTLPAVTDTLAVLGANTFTAGQYILPAANSTTTFRVATATATLLLGVDTTNRYVTFAGDAFSVNTNTGELRLYNAGALCWVSGGGASAGTVDLKLSRGTAATLQQGGADSAAPVAQTYRSSGSRAGTDTNVGGSNLTFQSGTGTGIGTLSSTILRSPILVASGTGAQTLVTSLTITQGVAVRAVYTVGGLPAASAALKGGMAWVTDATMGMITGYGTVPIGGGANEAPVSCNGTNWVIG